MGDKHRELFDINELSEIEIDWLLENEELLAIEKNNKLKNGYIKIGDRKIRNCSNARNGILGLLNKQKQKERQEKYWDRVANGRDIGKIRVVSEGDSWFNYPTKLPEVIDHIFDDFSIFSMGYGGDWLANIYKEQEYLQAIRLYRPEVFLISGGGNDLVGGKRMMEVLHRYKAGASGNELVKADVFQSILDDFSLIYSTMFKQIELEFPDLKIICHGYDFPYFEGQEKKWFGVPFKRKGIKSLQVRNEIGEHLINHFNQMLYNVSNDFKNVSFLNNTGLVPRDQWKDELHPNDKGFALVAEKFRKKIVEVT